MSILSTNQKLIKVGQDYSAGSGISIDDGVISVTGEFGKTYSAGQNVDIYEQDEQLYISSKDWTNDIANASANAYNEAVAQIPDPFDPTYLSAQIDNKLNSSDFTAWQDGQYSTDLQTIEGQINNKLDTSSFSDVSGSFLTAHQSLDGYATEDWVTAQGYITGVDLSNYYTKDETSGKEELANAFDNIPVGDPEVNAYVTDNSASLNGTTDLVQNSSGLWNDVAVYQSNSANYLTAHQDISYKLDESAFADVSGTFLTAHQSLDGYATVEDVESATSGLFPNSAVSPLVNDIMANVVYYSEKPTTSPIYASYNTLGNVNAIGGSAIAINTSNLYVSGIVTGTNVGFTANGISAGNNRIALLCNNANISAGEGHIDFSQKNSVSVSFDNLGLHMTAAGYNNIPQYLTTYTSGTNTTGPVLVYSATNSSGAGFIIWAGGAKGFDANGNTIWDTSVVPSPNNLIGYGDTQISSGGLNGNIILTTLPKANTTNPLSSAPNTVLNSYGLRASYGTNAPSVNLNPSQISIEYNTAHMTATYNDVKVSTYTAYSDPNKIEWSLTGSVQKREIEYDADTSAITAINGSAIGGGGVTGEFVPQSAFDELKQSYDALSSLFATYSGQWLLPNEGGEE